MPNTETFCSRCGASLSDAAEGLCIRCLLSGALTPPEEEVDVAASLESPATLLERRDFANYELLGEIARGGMGVVFRARQKKPDRIVALKVIAAGELATPRMVERFRTEAEAAARLDHPNIVPIYEVGHTGGWHYFSMRLIEGCTLAEKFPGRALPAEEAAKLMAKIARAVQHAHQRGILHRDLKPNNILIDARGEPHLTDFGLAKMVESSVEMTLSNVVLGTPAYMAPEQAAGGTRDVTVSVDVYGLGAVFYEMLTGRPPFEAPNTHALLRKVAEEDPVPPSRCDVRGERNEPRSHPSALTSHISTDLDAICLKCLEKEPALRYHTAEQFADDLERALRGEPIVAQPSTATQRMRKWVRRNPAKAGLFATAAAALLVVAVISLAFNVRLTRARDRAESSDAQARQQLVSEHLQQSAQLNAAGDALRGMLPLIEALGYEQTNGAFTKEIRQRLSATLQFSPRLVRLWDAGGTPVQLQFSADEQQLIAVLRSGEPRVWDLKTRKVLPHPNTTGYTHRASIISPDGSRIVEFFHPVPVGMIWDLKSNTLIRMEAHTSNGGVAAFSPDGKIFASGGDRVRMWDAQTGAALPITFSNETRCLWMTFSPDGKELLTGHNSDVAWRWNVSTGERLGEALTISPTPRPQFSSDGQRLLMFSTGLVQVLDWKAGAITSSVPGGSILYDMMFSPDAKQFATASFRDQARVWNVATSRSFQLPLTHESGANKVVFSPDGSMLATAGFDYEVRLVRAANHRLVVPAIHHSALIEAIAFSADNRFLAIGDVDGVVQVWDLKTGAQPFLLGDELTRRAANTVDGKWMVSEDIRGALHISDLEAGTELGESWSVPSPPSHVSIDPEAHHIAGAFRQDGARIWDFSTRKLLHHITGTNETTREILGVLFKPDGSEFVTVTPQGLLQRWSMSSGKVVGSAMKHNGAIGFLHWSRDSKWIATGGGRTISLWDAESGSSLGEPLRCEEREGLNEVGFTPDSKYFVMAPGNQSIEPAFARIYELPSLRPIAALRHGDGVASAAFSRDSQLVATGGEDNVAQIWRVKDGQRVGGALRHPGIVLRLLFSPDGRWLATGCADGNLRVWDVQRSELVMPPIQLGAATRPLCFSRNGSRVYVAVATPKECVWTVDCAPLEMPFEQIRVLAECETGQRADRALGAVPLSAFELATKFSTLGADNAPLASAEELTRWHLKNAAVAERHGAWFTAAFHLKRLLAVKSDDAALNERLETAESQLETQADRR